MTTFQLGVVAETALGLIICTREVSYYASRSGEGERCEEEEGDEVEPHDYRGLSRELNVVLITNVNADSRLFRGRMKELMKEEEGEVERRWQYTRYLVC